MIARALLISPLRSIGELKGAIVLKLKVMLQFTEIIIAKGLLLRIVFKLGQYRLGITFQISPVFWLPFTGVSLFLKYPLLLLALVVIFRDGLALCSISFS